MLAALDDEDEDTVKVVLQGLAFTGSESHRDKSRIQAGRENGSCQAAGASSACLPVHCGHRI